jgi:hypothetical protein
MKENPREGKTFSNSVKQASERNEAFHEDELDYKTKVYFPLPAITASHSCWKRQASYESTGKSEIPDSDPCAATLAWGDRAPGPLGRIQPHSYHSGDVVHDLQDPRPQESFTEVHGCPGGGWMS